MDSFFSILNWVLTQISFTVLNKREAFLLFFFFFFLLLRGTQACVCGINWSVRCWWRSCLQSVGSWKLLPACLHPFFLFQALHCTILVQHDMHMWLLPSIAIKHCLFHRLNHTAEEQLLYREKHSKGKQRQQEKMLRCVTFYKTGVTLK